MEVSVSGYVKGDFIYDTHNNVGRSVNANAVAIGGGDDENFQAHARQSRFRIKSKSDTAVGQIRTLIEGDFEANTSSGGFRLRHAWGEWDMTPDLTFGAGQTWSTFMPLNGLAPTVDFGGPTGVPFVRQAMVRLTHTSGPITTHIALENANTDLTTSAGVAVNNGGGSDVASQLPDLVAAMQYNGPGGTLFHLSGIARELHVDRNAPGGATNDTEIGYGVNAAADLPLGEIFTLYGTAAYGDGLGRYLLNSGNLAGVVNAAGNINTTEVYGVTAGGSFKLSEASSINGNWGYERHGNALAATGTRSLMTVHATYLLQPVSKLRMGVEGIWAKRTLVGGVDDENLRFQFGTWFFF